MTHILEIGIRLVLLTKLNKKIFHALSKTFLTFDDIFIKKYNRSFKIFFVLETYMSMLRVDFVDDYIRKTFEHFCEQSYH